MRPLPPTRRTRTAAVATRPGREAGLVGLAAVLLAGLGLMLAATIALADNHGKGQAASHASGDQADESVPPVLRFTMKDIHGEPVKLRAYHGQVVLMVNTASKCGLTPQYKPLQALHEKYGKQGLAILAFPANNFGKQEPGTDEQIKRFCESTFGVSFDLFSKISVKGDDQHPLYAFLTDKRTNGEFAGPIKWNFTKFLVSRQGEVVARFEPRTRPDSEAMVEAIEAELAKAGPVADENE
jgi:glutathione peroxidase